MHDARAGAPDLDGTARHIDFQIRNGIHGVVCCGSLGEASTLTLEEKLAVARCALETSAGRVPVLATVTVVFLMLYGVNQTLPAEPVNEKSPFEPVVPLICSELL